MSEFIRIEHLNKSFNGRQVLKDLTFSIPVGQITAVMAPSGVGKTTLLRILMGLETADSGQIEGLNDVRLSAVFQEDRLCENLSASANIRLVRQKKPWGRDREEVRQIREAMTAAGLSGCEDQPIRELSGGMRRRVALLRALCCDWDILFLDEPFKGLDEETKNQVMDYTKEMCAGKTVIFVTHDSKEAAQMGAVCISLDHKEEERQ